MKLVHLVGFITKRGFEYCKLCDVRVKRSDVKKFSYSCCCHSVAVVRTVGPEFDLTTCTSKQTNEFEIVLEIFHSIINTQASILVHHKRSHMYKFQLN